MPEPTSLQEAIIYFASPDNCRDYLVARRWPEGVTCPTCGSKDVKFLTNQNRWWCPNEHPKRQFSVKVGTIYEESPLGLDKWLTATWLITNCKNGVSSCEIARALKITQKSAWFLDHRIRLSFGIATPDKLTGECEADETFIGQKARNMHANVRARKITGTGGKDKTMVMGILERGKDGKPSQIRTKVVANRRKKALQAEVREHVQAGAALYTDALKSYESLDEFQHEVVDHAVEYVREKVHTNGCENFWSLTSECSTVSVLYSLFYVREFSGVSPSRFLTDLMEEVQGVIPDTAAWPGARARLEALLEIETLNTLSKAIGLQRDGERLYCDSKILSDIRPVFLSDASMRPRGAVITHTLKIGYHEGKEHKEFFVVLDMEDLEELRDVIERAHVKSQTLSGLLEDAKLSDLGR